MSSQQDAFGDGRSSGAAVREPAPEREPGLRLAGGARRLFAEIESYLEFVAIARTPA